MPVVMESFAEHFDYNFSLIKDEMYQQFPKEFTQFMREESSSRPFEKRTYISGLGLPIKNRDMQPLPFQDPAKGLVSTFTPTTYRIGYMIDRQSIEDEQWGLLASRPKSMVYGSIVIKDMVAANLLNNGLVLQTYDLGGVPLFSESHLREDEGALWSNLIPDAQPITVETVFNAINNLLGLLNDARGLPIAYNGSVNLIVPMINSVLYEQAVSVVNSIYNPDTADNRINAAVKQFKINVIASRYLTNPDLWFVAWEPSAPNFGLTLINRTEATITALKPFGDNDDVWYSYLRMRFTAGYENQRGFGAVGAAA